MLDKLTCGGLLLFLKALQFLKALHKKLLWSPRLFLRVQWLPETRKSANCSTNGLPYKWQVPVHTRAMNEQIGFSCFSDLEAVAGTGGRDTY